MFINGNNCILILLVKHAFKVGIKVFKPKKKKKRKKGKKKRCVTRIRSDRQTLTLAATPNGTSSDVIEPYDVVAVIGSTQSSQSVAVSHVLGPAQVPLVSFFSTSDDLSNKRLFPYFLRTTPPDRSDPVIIIINK